MLTLGKLDRHPRRRQIAGVTVTMRPATSIESNQAEAEAARLVADWLKAPQGLREFGLDAFGDVDAFADDETTESVEDQLDKVVGLTRFLVNALLFEALVSEWEGVVDEAEKPAPLNRFNAGRFLLDPDRMRAFESAAWGMQQQVSAEGNGFAASPNGSVGAAETTAEVAPN